MSADSLKEFATAEHALKYLARVDRISHRTEGEAVLREFVPREARRILDLGTGNGRLLALGITEAEEDPSSQLAPMELQLQWLREIDFGNVDCHWKWLELALLGGAKPR